MAVVINGNNGISYDDSGIQYYGTGDDLAIYHDGSNAYITNSTGTINITDANVGINTSSPTYKLDVSGTGRFTNIVRFENYIQFAGTISTPQTAAAIYRPADNELAFSTSNTERMRINSSGDVGIGTSSPARRLDVSDDNVPPVRINRDTDFGNLVELRKSGTTMGTIGLEDSHLRISSDATSKAIIFTGYSGANETRLAISSIAGLEAFRPFNSFSDNLFDLGSSSRRFKDLYLSGGVYLGGTASANYLDDYEEGTWTPEIEPYQIDGGSLSVTYSYQHGHYVKIGNVVTIQFYIAITAFSTSANTGRDMHIVNLPYTENTTSTASEAQSLGVLVHDGLSGLDDGKTVGTGYCRANSYVNGNGSYHIQLNDSVRMPIEVANMPASSTVSFEGSVTYRTS